MESLKADQFDRTLDQWEYHLEMPMIPGELAVWAGQVHNSTCAVQQLLENHLAQAHPEQYSEIINRDLSLSRRVEQLRQEDAEILKAYNDLAARIKRFADAAQRREEAALLGWRDKLIQDGLKLVVRIHKQEVAVDIWYIEAFARDVGAPD